MPRRPSRARSRKPRNPRSRAEWQEAVDTASFLLAIDAARQYGLIEGGPKIDLARCDEILRLAKRRGILPAPIDALCDRFGHLLSPSRPAANRGLGPGGV